MWDPKLANFYKERLYSAYAFDVWGPYFREYSYLNKNVGKAWHDSDMSNWFIDVTHSGPGLKLE